MSDEVKISPAVEIAKDRLSSSLDGLIALAEEDFSLVYILDELFGAVSLYFDMSAGCTEDTTYEDVSVKFRSLAIGSCDLISAV